MNSAVLIHKSPASWNKAVIEKHELSETIASIEGRFTPFPNSEVFEEMRNSDIYFSIFKGLCKEFEIDEIHVVQAFDNSEIRNYSTEGKNGFIHQDGIKFWSIDNISDLTPFFDCDLLMTRGQYPNFHQQVRKIRGHGRGCWVHYPATAQFYPWFEEVAKSWEKDFDQRYDAMSKLVSSFLDSQNGRNWKAIRLLSLQGVHKSLIEKMIEIVRKQRKELCCGAYDIVLIDDSNSISKRSEIYPNSILLPFTKPSLPIEIMDNQSEREIDLIFCGTTLVPTKNHHSLVKILRDLDKTGKKFRIIVVGDEGSRPEFTKSTNSYFANITVENIGVVPRKELFSLFSKSKTCLVLSGRDCNPRIISEAASHGCRILAANTLSDGFQVIDKYPLLGSIIHSPMSRFEFDSKTSPSPDVSGFADKIALEIAKSTHPHSTSRLACNLFNLENSVEAISSSIKLVL